MDDKILLKRFLEGDEESFKMILNKYERKILNLLYTLTKGDIETARELTQETFLKFIRASGLLKGESSIGTWLYRVAYNTFLDFKKKNKIQSTELDERSYETKEYNIEEVITNKTIYEYLKFLKKEQATSLILFYYHDLSIKEISEILKTSESNVKILLFRGKENLRKILLKEK